MRAFDDGYKACHECDLISRIPHLGAHVAGTCRRCGASLFKEIPNSIELSLLLTVTTLVLFFIANTFPLLTFKLEGREQVASMVTGVFALYRQGYSELAVLVALCSIIIPFVRLMTGVYLFLPLYLGYKPPMFEKVFPIYHRLAPWAMMEVYLLSLIVAYVKLSDFATLVIGVAAYTLMTMILVISWSASVVDARAVWRRADELSADNPDGSVSKEPFSATGVHLSCHNCELLVTHPAHRCPRCGSALHARKTNSISTAWAFLLAAAILYIPANLLPIMTVISFGEGEPDTILSGVKALIAAEMYPVAILVFVASIFVPVLKIGLLAFLLISVQLKWQWRPRQRALLYRLTESVGRWSMIDIFMISILAGLVQLGALATIEPGAGAVFFAAVVILTMIAASSFDPRLMWDVMRDGHE